LLKIFRCSSRNENHARAVSLYLPRKWRTGQPLLRGAWNYAKANWSAENPTPKRNPRLKLTRADSIIKNPCENKLLSKKRCDPEILLSSDLSNSRPSQSRETTPLRQL
jgi:hypothetical protein